MSSGNEEEGSGPHHSASSSDTSAVIDNVLLSLSNLLVAFCLCTMEGQKQLHSFVNYTIVYRPMYC